ncbi:MAG: hypothetical protein JO154_21190 [Chitinophaga sp.]|nr:hypothetical protein [Chitinophaga sp.]
MYAKVGVTAGLGVENKGQDYHLPPMMMGTSCKCYLNGETYNGVRILSRNTVRMMRMNETSNLQGK